MASRKGQNTITTNSNQSNTRPARVVDTKDGASFRGDKADTWVLSWLQDKGTRWGGDWWPLTSAAMTLNTPQYRLNYIISLNRDSGTIFSGGLIHTCSPQIPAVSQLTDEVKGHEVHHSPPGRTRAERHHRQNKHHVTCTHARKHTHWPERIKT